MGEKVLLTGSKDSKLLRYLTMQWLKQRTLRAWRGDISTCSHGLREAFLEGGNECCGKKVGLIKKGVDLSWVVARAERMSKKPWAHCESTRWWDMACPPSNAVLFPSITCEFLHLIMLLLSLASGTLRLS